MSDKSILGQQPSEAAELSRRKRRSLKATAATTASIPERKDDRDPGGAGDDAPHLPVMVRFRDLKAAGIATSWPTLLRLIREQSFPPGLRLGEHIRAWRLADIEAWLASRSAATETVCRPHARKAVTPLAGGDDASE
jgi:predicted DNA-binding transcriptional regulator AlpA